MIPGHRTHMINTNQDRAQYNHYVLKIKNTEEKWGREREKQRKEKLGKEEILQASGRKQKISGKEKEKKKIEGQHDPSQSIGEKYMKKISKGKKKNTAQGDYTQPRCQNIKRTIQI